MFTSTALVGYVVAALFVLLGAGLEIGARYYGLPGGPGRYAFAIAALIVLAVITFSLLFATAPPA